LELHQLMLLLTKKLLLTILSLFSPMLSLQITPMVFMLTMQALEINLKKF